VVSAVVYLGSTFDQWHGVMVRTLRQTFCRYAPSSVVLYCSVSPPPRYGQCVSALLRAALLRSAPCSVWWPLLSWVYLQRQVQPAIRYNMRLQQVCYALTCQGRTYSNETASQTNQRASISLLTQMDLASCLKVLGAPPSNQIQG
jgi:hypothetical protein